MSGEFVKPITKVTQHAVDRYMQRSGCKSLTASVNKLLERANKVIPIGKNRVYQGGWIVAIRRGAVVTCYKPRTPEQLGAVFRACQSTLESSKPSGLCRSREMSEWHDENDRHPNSP